MRKGEEGKAQAPGKRRPPAQLGRLTHQVDEMEDEERTSASRAAALLSRPALRKPPLRVCVSGVSRLTLAPFKVRAAVDAAGTVSFSLPAESERESSSSSSKTRRIHEIVGVVVLFFPSRLTLHTHETSPGGEFEAKRYHTLSSLER